MIAIILGGAPSVFEGAAGALLLLNRRHMVVAANLAGIHFSGRLDAWCSLHTDRLPKWVAERPGELAARLFTPPTPDERWPGSSGLYALQCALFEMGATAAILCGVPMEQAAGHFIDPGAWAATGDYRQAFISALPEVGGRVRSMGGWTAGLFGEPTREWIDAVDNIKPLGASRPTVRSEPMHRIKNGGETSQRFNARRPDGNIETVLLGPGESVTREIDPNQAVFARGLLKATHVSESSEPKTKGGPASSSET